MTQYHSEITIVGAGFIGSTLAYTLAKRGFDVTLIERNPPKIQPSSTETSHDWRGIAITAKSKEMLENFGLWDALAPFASPIEQIRITDQHHPLFLHFDPDLTGIPMGYMILSYQLEQALSERLASLPHLRIVTGTAVTQLDTTPSLATLTLSNGDTLTTPLVIAADGKHSTLRYLGDISTRHWDYERQALVAVIHHSEHHHYTAQEHFYPAGPFAVLPLSGGHHASIVWTDTPDTVATLRSLPTVHFLTFLQQKLDGCLGDISLTSNLHAYPLIALQADRYVRERMLLVGDAAHTIHPIAGQGLNMGFQDCDSVVSLLTEYKALGLDIGSELLLEAYHHARRTDNFTMFAITHSLEKLFAKQGKLTKLARRTGLATIQRIPRLKRFFVEYAMGQR